MHVTQQPWTRYRPRGVGYLKTSTLASLLVEMGLHDARIWSVLARILNPAHEQDGTGGLVIQEVDEGTGCVDH